MTFYEELLDYLPDEIKTSSDFQKILKIYMSMLEEQNEISQDTIQVKLVDSLYEKFSETKEIRYSETRSAILKTALNEIFWTLNDAEKSTELYNKLATLYKRLGLPTSSIDMVKKVEEILTEQNIIVNKSFNTNKGKYSGYLYIYDLVDKSQVQGVNTGGFLNLIEGTELDPKEPFNYRVETSLYKETYEQLIHPMVHPIGFGYLIRTILEFSFEDYFSSKAEITLEEAKIRCLQPDGSYIETDILQEYDVQSFQEQEKEGLKRFWVIVKDKKTGEKIKFVSEYDNSVKSYSLDNLKIYDVELVNPGEGIIEPFFYNDGSLQKIKYNQYFINRKKYVEIKYKIVGDLDNTNYVSYVPINPDNLSKVPDENFLTEIYITPDVIFNNTLEEMNGRTIEIYDRNCGFTYSIKVEYVTTMTDENIVEIDSQFDDWWNRKNKCSTVDFFIDRVEDWTKNPSSWIPYLNDENLYIGMKSEGCDCPAYYIGLGVNYCKDPEERWMPVIDEYYIGQKSKVYNKYYKDQNLPEINDLGKDTQYWVYDQPAYNRKKSSTEQSSTKYQQSSEYSPAFEALYGEQEIHPDRYDYIPEYNHWCIGDEGILIGDNYSDDELKLISEKKQLPSKGRMNFIGISIKPKMVEGEYFGKIIGKDTEYGIKITTPKINERGFYINNDYSDEEILKIKSKEIEIKNPIFPLIGEKIEPYYEGYNFIPLGISGIREDFSVQSVKEWGENNPDWEDKNRNISEKITVDEEIDFDTKDIKITYPLIGEEGFYINNDYSDEELQKIKNLEKEISSPVFALIGEKIIPENLSGERFSKYEQFTEEFDIVVIKRIFVPEIGEPNYEISDEFSDEDVQKIKELKLRNTKSVYLIGERIDPIPTINM